jgi:hypothetical protein
VSVSLSTFIPKPFTPFEFEPQSSKQEIDERQKYLLSITGNKKIHISWSDYDTSFLEAVLARGDRRVSKAIFKAHKKGCKLDAWGEFFKPELWYEAFAECGIDPTFYVNRRRKYDEIMPWSHLNMLFDRKFLIEENKKAHMGEVTANCREKCAGCGLNKTVGGVCFD